MRNFKCENCNKDIVLSTYNLRINVGGVDHNEKCPDCGNKLVFIDVKREGEVGSNIVKPLKDRSKKFWERKKY